MQSGAPMRGKPQDKVYDQRHKQKLSGGSRSRPPADAAELQPRARKLNFMAESESLRK
jgi:hypothetical protein